MRYRILSISFLCVLFLSCNMEIESKETNNQEKVKYTVTYESKHGTIPRGITVNDGTVLSESQLPDLIDQNSMYTFLGWFDSNNVRVSAGSFKITKDTIIYAKWDLKRFIVSFITSGGTAIQSQNVTYGTQITKPIDPKKDNYDFKGWYTDRACTDSFDLSTNIIRNTTLYAKWDLKQYTVSFNTVGGAEIKEQNVEYGNTITRPIDPNKDDYDFAGWYTDAAYITPFDFTTKIICNITLYAKWDLKYYTVSFNTNGGTGIESQYVEHGKTITKPLSPEKKNYQFLGWYTDINCTNPFDFETIIDDKLTLYAKWDYALAKTLITISIVDESDISVEVKKDDSTVTFETSDRYTSYKWFLENSIVSTEYFYTLPISTLGDDSYELYLEVEDGENLYSYFATIKK